MGLANVERPVVRGTKQAKGIHYVVFKEKTESGVNEWDSLTKFWGTDSPAVIADDVLASIKNAGDALEAAVRLGYVADKEIRDAAVKGIKAIADKAIADSKAKKEAADKAEKEKKEKK